MEDQEARELVWAVYRQGAQALALGWVYDPPDSSVLKRAYHAGYEDELNGTPLAMDEVYGLIFGS
jgi:hypothetical protein